MKIRKLLTIAGSDSGGGAGIQADLKTFAALGAYGSSVITAITAQNTRGVQQSRGVPRDLVAQQIDAVLGDIGADAVKTGMMWDEGIVEQVVDRLTYYKPPCLVVDPVIMATSGAPLLNPGGVDMLREKLLPLASFISPNLDEAAALCGFEVEDEPDIKKAAREFHARGAGFVVITGIRRDRMSVDYGYDGSEFRAIAGPVIDTPHDHGTGCTFSAALATYAAQGFSSWQALSMAKNYVAMGLRFAYQVGTGPGPLNHMAHFNPGSLAWPEIKDTQADLFRNWGCQSLLGQSPWLNLIIGGPLCAGRDYADLTRRAVENGVGLIQLREKNWETRELIDVAKEMLPICREHGALLIINDRVDVALAAGADGVHLGQDDLDPLMARAILGPEKIIGISASTLPEAQAAAAVGADYLGVLAYPSPSKDCTYQPGGPALLAEMKDKLHIPLIAIGGITPQNTEPLLDAGASGVAVISSILGADDPAEVIRQFKTVFSSRKNRSI